MDPLHPTPTEAHTPPTHQPSPPTDDKAKALLKAPEDGNIKKGLNAALNVKENIADDNKEIKEKLDKEWDEYVEKEKKEQAEDVVKNVDDSELKQGEEVDQTNPEEKDEKIKPEAEFDEKVEPESNVDSDEIQDQKVEDHTNEKQELLDKIQHDVKNDDDMYFEGEKDTKMKHDIDDHKGDNGENKKEILRVKSVNVEGVTESVTIFNPQKDFQKLKGGYEIDKNVADEASVEMDQKSDPNSIANDAQKLDEHSDDSVRKKWAHKLETKQTFTDAIDTRKKNEQRQKEQQKQRDAKKKAAELEAQRKKVKRLKFIKEQRQKEEKKRQERLLKKEEERIKQEQQAKRKKDEEQRKEEEEKRKEDERKRLEEEERELLQWEKESQMREEKLKKEFAEEAKRKAEKEKFAKEDVLESTATLLSPEDLASKAILDSLNTIKTTETVPSVSTVKYITPETPELDTLLKELNDIDASLEANNDAEKSTSKLPTPAINDKVTKALDSDTILDSIPITSSTFLPRKRTLPQPRELTDFGKVHLPENANDIRATDSPLNYHGRKVLEHGTKVVDVEVSAGR